MPTLQTETDTRHMSLETPSMLLQPYLRMDYSYAKRPSLCLKEERCFVDRLTPKYADEVVDDLAVFIQNAAQFLTLLMGQELQAALG